MIDSLLYVNELLDDFVNTVFLADRWPEYFKRTIIDRGLKMQPPQWITYAKFMAEQLILTEGALINADGMEAVIRVLIGDSTSF